METIKTISIEDANYPLLLKKIPNPPKILYYLGEMKKEENCIAIVGARRCTSYGKEAASKIAGELVENNITVVSGYAPGIDTFAHLKAIEKGKRTIAVLGTGLDKKVIYPRSNARIMEKILACNGCLMSEYPPETRGTKFTFPQRNRIIAGLCLGTVVVEAKEKSGSLITANFARQYKRKVFAVPGSIFSQNSKGTHYLIKQQAILIESGYDILKEFKFSITQSFEKIDGANKEETMILKILESGASSVEKIIEKTGLSPATVAATLAILEIKNKIKTLGENIYTLMR